MAAKILALFNLKEGTSVADYEAWAKTVSPPYEYFETIDILDMDKFGTEAGSDTMQKVAAEFRDMVKDLVFITTEQL